MLVDDNLATDDTVEADFDVRRRQDRRWLTLAGGAALVVLALLVIAVLYTARSSIQPIEAPGFATTVPSATKSSAISTTALRTSYLPPSVSTSAAVTTVEPIAPIETAPVATTQDAPFRHLDVDEDLRSLWHDQRAERGGVPIGLTGLRRRK